MHRPLSVRLGARGGDDPVRKELREKRGSTSDIYHARWAAGIVSGRSGYRSGASAHSYYVPQPECQPQNIRQGSEIVRVNYNVATRHATRPEENLPSLS